MKKKSRLLSVFIAVMMTSLLFAGFTVEAASPLHYEADAVDVFNQSFGGLDSSADAPDFYISGSGWSYTKYFMSTSVRSTQIVRTSSNIDLSDSIGFEFSAKISVTNNGFRILMPGGYDIYWTHSKRTYDGLSITDIANVAVLRKDDTVLAGAAFDAYLEDTEWIIKYLNGTWTVTAVQKKQTAEVFSYVDESNPTFNGQFGVQNQSTGTFTVFNMSLVKFPGIVTVNQWKYETDFKLNDTPAKYAADGLTLPSPVNAEIPFVETTTSYGSGIGFNAVTNSPIVTYIPSDGKITGDYSFTFDYLSGQWNALKVQFNYIDSNNYYELRCYANTQSDITSLLTTHPTGAGVVLLKYVGGTPTLLGEADTPYFSKAMYHRIIVNVSEEDGTVNISASTREAENDPEFTRPTTRNSFVEGADNSPFADGGYIRIRCGAMGSAFRIYGFSACSLVSDADKSGSVLSDWYSGNKPEYVARFYGSDDSIIGAVTTGNIYFEYPTARLGSYLAVATLYENHRMTGIKVITPEELYSGKIKLFRVTDAENAKVRVYFIDSETSLNRLVDVYELN